MIGKGKAPFGLFIGFGVAAALAFAATKPPDEKIVIESKTVFRS